MIKHVCCSCFTDVCLCQAKQCLITNTSVPHKKKDPELVVPSAPSDGNTRVKDGQRKNGMNVLPSHFGPKIRHKKRLHSQTKSNGGKILQKVMLNCRYCH